MLTPDNLIAVRDPHGFRPLALGRLGDAFVVASETCAMDLIGASYEKVKLNTVRSIIEGKRVVLVDDSIVRGTTSRKIVGMVKAAGAREMHMRISCPPTVSPCYYGIDTPHRDELIASKQSVDEIRKFLDADTLSYLSLNGLREAVGARHDHYCNACYTRQYPVAPPSDSDAYMQMVLKLPNSGDSIES